MLAQLIQVVQYTTDTVVQIMTKTVGQTMMGHGFMATVINKIGNKSKTVMAMESVITTALTVVMQSLDLQGILNQALEINSHSILVNTKITITMAMVIMKVI